MTTDRATTVVIYSSALGRFHFTEEPLRVFPNGQDVWFFLDSQRGLFQCIEKIMVETQVAHHVVDIELLREDNVCTDFRVTYAPAPKV